MGPEGQGEAALTRLAPIFPVVLAALGLSGCNILCPINASCPKEESGGGSSEDPAATIQSPAGQPETTNGGVPSAPPVIPTAPSETVTKTTSAAGFNLTRLSPEQISKNLLLAVGFSDYRYQNEYLGVSDDYLVDIFGVGLGGVDFIATSFRDPSTKAQTLLIARVIAWQVAKLTTLNDYWAIWDTSRTKRVFTVVDMYGDDPESSRWRDQAQDLFWRLYSRPPSEAEMAALTSTFLAVGEAESALPQGDRRMRGWLAILYAMLASQEFWHI